MDACGKRLCHTLLSCHLQLTTITLTLKADCYRHCCSFFCVLLLAVIENGDIRRLSVFFFVFWGGGGGVRGCPCFEDRPGEVSG